MRAAYAIELIDQKIREASHGLRIAKGTLASLVQRQRNEGRQIAILANRIADLTSRGREAISAGRIDLGTEAAEAIAALENEFALRRQTQDRLKTRMIRLQNSVEAANRRIIDLKQGAVAARALRDEQALQIKLNTTLTGQSPMAEAEALIAQVLGRDDPCEQSEIPAEIDRGLSRENIVEKLANTGLVRKSKSQPQMSLPVCRRRLNPQEFEMKRAQADNGLFLSHNLAGVAAAYVLLTISLWLSTDVPLATKGYWGMAVLLLTISLINVVKYSFDAQASIDRISQLEEAHNERLLAEFVTDKTKA